MTDMLSYFEYSTTQGPATFLGYCSAALAGLATFGWQGGAKWLGHCPAFALGDGREEEKVAGFGILSLALRDRLFAWVERRLVIPYTNKS